MKAAVRDHPLPGTPGIAAIVLAGGASRRMGTDKALLRLGGRTLVQHVVDRVSEVADEVIVIGGHGRPPPAVECDLPLLAASDPVPNGGPLVGLAQGLRLTTAPVAIVVGCDMPFVEPALLRLVAREATAASPVVMPLHSGLPEPLCSAWRTELLPALESQLRIGQRSVVEVARALGLKLLNPADYADADPDGSSFRNLNTPREFAAASAGRGEASPLRGIDTGLRSERDAAERSRPSARPA